MRGLKARPYLRDDADYRSAAGTAYICRVTARDFISALCCTTVSYWDGPDIPAAGSACVAGVQR